MALKITLEDKGEDFIKYLKQTGYQNAKSNALFPLLFQLLILRYIMYW